MDLQHFISEFLTYLEKREERLLSWGFYNVSWTIEDIENSFFDDAPDELIDSWHEIEGDAGGLESVLYKMRLCNLIYRVRDDEKVYRTRFAEGVRLLANLRQMFKFNDWSTGPRLVSDIKLQVSPRQYPRRDFDIQSVWGRLKELCPPEQTDLLKDCFLALGSNAEGEHFEFSGFQVRSFENIIKQYSKNGLSGSVVCAGTGSGKTKAFYVPAYLSIVQSLNEAPYTKIIAIYPRNVLLADQLREAISEAEKLRPILEKNSLRPIRFGALLGETPRSSWFPGSGNHNYKKQRWHWERRGSGSVLPYLKSPLDGGKSDLIWRDEDREAGRTCLYREAENEPDVPDQVLGLTREDLAKNPPDVLFLSLEMLNREMCNPRWKKTFGVMQGVKAPKLLLLDELHAQEGIPGAQTAWVLRRWRHWSKIYNLHVVGLSATLRDAPTHLARVAGMSPSRVSEFKPKPGIGEVGEMVSEGGEYNLVLKGDPVAGKALLSSTIQAGMLLARLLTPLNASAGADNLIDPLAFYRRKVFGFSDNLDSVNRWLINMTDAEKRNANHPLLASLRIVNDGLPNLDRMRRYAEGQEWELPTLIGHNLDSGLRVSRCSSQDPGADTSSNLIIASSSLEVGFDDPDVGIVLHHKSPRSMSSFIQRKGRAGRTRGSRPWTVTVLSDYGKDRWAFNSAEKLFQPEVDSLVLPLLNPYVLRVQLAHFLIDWIGIQIGCDAFSLLKGHNDYYGVRGLQIKAKNLVYKLMERGDVWDNFRNQVLSLFKYNRSLEKEDFESLVDDLLWHEPRPLLMEVLPSLLRKLETNWSYAHSIGGGKYEDMGAKRPLPKYIPQATFAALDVGEVLINLESSNGIERAPESMLISKALYGACPGKISKHFSTGIRDKGYWHEYSASLLEKGSHLVSIEKLFPENSYLGEFSGIKVYSPETIKLVHRPFNVSDSSNAQWVWKSSIKTEGEGEILPLGQMKEWSALFRGACAYLHSNAAWMELVRYTSRCNFDIGRGRTRTTGSLDLAKVDGETKVQAVGFSSCVDGLRFILSSEHLDSRPGLTGAMEKRLRVDYFKYAVAHSSVLIACEVNEFKANWLSEMSLSMLTATALSTKCTIKEAASSLKGKRDQAAKKVLEAIFQAQGVNADGDEEEAKLKITLIDAYNSPTVQNEITKLEAILWDDLPIAFYDWVRERYAVTLIQAIKASMISLSPEVSDDDLVVDVVPRESGGYDLCVSETSPGGVGQIEQILFRIKSEPKRFIDGVEYALHNCSREQGAKNLIGVISSCSDSGSLLADAFARIRNANGFEEMESGRDHLKHALQVEGFSVSRSMIVSIVNKLIRPGSNSTIDKLIYCLNERWQRAITRLQLPIDPRVYAYTNISHPRVCNYLRNLFEEIGGEVPTDPQLFVQLQQLLVGTCSDSCPDCLEERGRYYEFAKPSRELARSWLNTNVTNFPLSEPLGAWFSQARELLQQEGRLCLEVEKACLPRVVSELSSFVITEIPVESRLETISIYRIDQLADKTHIFLHIKDFINV